MFPVDAKLRVREQAGSDCSAPEWNASMGNGEVSKLVVVISFVFFIIAFGFALGSEFKRSKVRAFCFFVI